MNLNNNTLARDFSLKFLFHLRLDAKPDFLEELKSTTPPLNLLKSEWTDFNLSYTETDIEHPNNRLNESSYTYAKAIINGILSKYDTLIGIISPYLNKRTIDKIHKMDFWILMIGTSELMMDEKIPHKVILNEAVEMAKKYGDNESYSFINGVLDKVAKEHFS
jgi:transcription antitermination protein NusB